MKHHYTDLATALADPEGVAVLGFFYQVSSLKSGAGATEARVLVELTPFCLYNCSPPSAPTASTSPSSTPSGASGQQVGFCTS